MIRGSFRVPAPFEFVFPYGALLLDVSAKTDFAKRGQDDDQERDKDTGERVWQATLLDLDPEAARWGKQQVKVKIIAPVQPVPPASPVPGYPPAVELVGLMLVPWVDDSKCTQSGKGFGDKCRTRMAFSMRAEAIVAPTSAPAGAAG